MTFGSLFAGIGGFDLGFERAGMTCKWQVEINPFSLRVLEKNWPNVRRHDDVCTFPPHPAESWHVDVVCGGFPCQDISNAGRRAGIDGERSGLWREFVRIVRVLRPRYVVVENSESLAVRGLDRVLGDFAVLGFDAEWSVVSACAMGAPHTRERLFVVAYPAGGREGQLWGKQCEKGREEARHLPWTEGEPRIPRMADGVPHRPHRIAGIGNAVTPPITEWIGRRLIEVAG